MKQVIKTIDAPGAIGPYSQGIKVNHMIYTSGQLPIDAKTGEVPKDIVSQTMLVLENIKAVLEEAGSSMDNIVKATVYLVNFDDFAVVNKIYESFFTGNFPARSAVEVNRLAKDALVEIEVIALA